ncbi:MAG: response regulator [Lachnospiraceae bacterium]|nr:response regulator [Lachnospiraceae bacterium]
MDTEKKSKEVKEENNDFSLGLLLEGRKYGNRGIKLLIKVIILALIPVLIMGSLTILISYRTVNKTMSDEVKNELKSTALVIESSYNVMSSDDFIPLKSGNIIKGTFVINNNYKLFDSLAEEGEIYSAMYYGENLVVTSLRDDIGKRIEVLPIPDYVYENVYKNQTECYISSLYIDNEQYFGYYMPIFNNDREVVGSVFTGKKTQVISEAVAQNIYMVSVVTGSGIILSLISAIILLLSVAKFVGYAMKEDAKVDELTKANRAKDSFLANMSHEIRTPINAVLGMDEMILRESTDQTILNYASSIKNAGQALLSLINDILDLSKIQAGRIELIESRYELASIINDTYNLLHQRAEKKDLELIIENDPTIPSELNGDETRIRQILTNIMTNAIKYTEEGTVKVVFGWQPVDEGNMILVMSVEDTGMGIKDGDIPKLFDSFARFDGTKNKSIEGTGLGLSITKSLIDLMNGTIDVRSTYGKGSVFTVRVPQKILTMTPMGDFAESIRNSIYHMEEYHESFVAPDAKILVVDDIRVNLEVIIGLLKQTKVQVDTAQSGGACLEAVMHKKYDLILMDHMMPEMDGVETLWMLKKTQDNLSKDAPVIALTANAVVGAKEQYLEWGFDDYLSKPVQGPALEACLAKYLPPEKVRIVTKEEIEIDKANKRKAIEEQSQRENFSTYTGSPEGDFEDGFESNAEPEKQSSLLDKLDFLDTETGLSYCLDEDTYRSILETYIEEDKTEDIAKFYEGKNWEDYRILVHAVKSTSLYIGAVPLSEKAKALENACIEEDWDYVNANHEDMLGNYKSLLGEIRKVL